ncbi:cytochrome c oxidase, cbb3-type, CcoQ subunit [Sulfurimonas sp. HSL-1716]|uniref:cytochrome c oxidase, cbb3-type, CcoQ subunit n=1 Tax=Hydrocurvibacter sulfurireducens TaxID=3131937 RepID=UPI0031F8F86E
MDIVQLQGYAYFGLVVFMVVILYSYIYHLYSSEKKGVKDYEKYGNIALNDEIDDAPVEKISKDEKNK